MGQTASDTQLDNQNYNNNQQQQQKPRSNSLSAPIDFPEQQQCNTTSINNNNRQVQPSIPPIQIPVRSNNNHSNNHNDLGSTRTTSQSVSLPNSYRQSSRVPNNKLYDNNNINAIQIASPTVHNSGLASHNSNSPQSTTHSIQFPSSTIHSNNASNSSLNTIIKSSSSASVKELENNNTNAIPINNSGNKSPHLVTAIETCREAQSELKRKLLCITKENQGRQVKINQIQQGINRLMPNKSCNSSLFRSQSAVDTATMATNNNNQMQMQQQSPSSNTINEDCNEDAWDFSNQRNKSNTQQIASSAPSNIDTVPLPEPARITRINYGEFDCNNINDTNELNTHLAGIYSYYHALIDRENKLSTILDNQLQELNSKYNGLRLRLHSYNSLIRNGCKITELENHNKTQTLRAKEINNRIKKFGSDNVNSASNDDNNNSNTNNNSCNNTDSGCNNIIARAESVPALASLNSSET